MSNTISIQGRLAGDPELRYAKSGTAVCNISVPDQKRRKNDAGEWEDASATTWFRVALFGDAAEAMANDGHKGDEVIVTGRLITRTFTDKEGQERSSLEVDFPKVAFVVGGRAADRQGGGFGGQGFNAPASDPWGQQSSGAPF